MTGCDRLDAALDGAIIRADIGPLVAWIALSLLALADILRIVLRETGWRPWTVGSLAVLVDLLAWAPTAALVLTAQLGVLVAWPVTALIGAWAGGREGARV